MWLMRHRTITSSTSPYVSPNHVFRPSLRLEAFGPRPCKALLSAYFRSAGTNEPWLQHRFYNTGQGQHITYYRFRLLFFHPNGRYIALFVFSVVITSVVIGNDEREMQLPHPTIKSVDFMLSHSQAPRYSQDLSFEEIDHGASRQMYGVLVARTFISPDHNQVHVLIGIGLRANVRLSLGHVRDDLMRACTPGFRRLAQEWFDQNVHPCQASMNDEMSERMEQKMMCIVTITPSSLLDQYQKQRVLSLYRSHFGLELSTVTNDMLASSFYARRRVFNSNTKSFEDAGDILIVYNLPPSAVSVLSFKERKLIEDIWNDFQHVSTASAAS